MRVNVTPRRRPRTNGGCVRPPVPGILPSIMVQNTLTFYGLCGAMLCAHVASARGVRLQGHAADADTGQPLALATVQVVGTFTGTIANP